MEKFSSLLAKKALAKARGSILLRSTLWAGMMRDSHVMQLIEHVAATTTQRREVQVVVRLHVWSLL